MRKRESETEKKKEGEEDKEDMRIGEGEGRRETKALFYYKRRAIIPRHLAATIVSRVLVANWEREFYKGGRKEDAKHLQGT